MAEYLYWGQQTQPLSLSALYGQNKPFPFLWSTCYFLFHFASKNVMVEHRSTVPSNSALDVCYLPVQSSITYEGLSVPDLHSTSSAPKVNIAPRLMLQ